jgi:RNA polymerase sigma-70 factor
MMAIESNYSEAADGELLKRVQAGEVEAFAPLVSRHLPTLRAFIAMKLPVPHLADEVAHEAFVFAFRHLQDFDARNSFRAWLRAIAWNLVRAELLRFAREQVNLSRFEQAQLAQLTADSQTATACDEALFLEECLAALPAGTRRLIEQRYHEGLTPDEIASLLGRSGEWARITLFRVRQQLRECVEHKLTKAAHGS